MEVGNWVEVRLGDFVLHQKGFAFKSSDYCTQGVPIVRVSNFTKQSIDMSACTYFDPITARQLLLYELKNRDVVIATVGSWPSNPESVVGKVICVPEQSNGALLNQNAVRLRAKAGIDQAFLYYLLKGQDFQNYIISTAQGSASQASIKLSDIFQFEFSLPSPSEQRGVAFILGALDDKIELNRKMNRTLEELAQGLFRSWFVDFDPVVAKREGRRPVGVPESVLALFPEHFDESELGPIPQGWKVESLDAVADFLNGLALQKFPPGLGDTLPVIKIADLRAGTSGGADRCGCNVPKEYVIADGDVLFSWSGTLVSDLWCGGKGALNQHLFKVTSSRFPKWFYFHWVNEHLPEFQGIAADKATTMGHIRRHHLTDAKVIVPSSLILRAMDVFQSPMIDQIVANRIENRSLETLRDTLLDPLLSGELSLKDAEHAVASVM